SARTSTAAWRSGATRRASWSTSSRTCCAAAPTRSCRSAGATATTTASPLVSIGGVQSTHTRQVAAVAAHLGLKCRLVQERWVDWDDPVNDKVGNILLSRIIGADTRLDPHGFDIGIRSSWEDALREVEESGGKPYGI